MTDKMHSSKQAKLLRAKAQEFLASRRNSNQLVEIMRHFESGLDTSACLLALELIFTTALRDNQLYLEVIPLKVPARTLEVQYVEWMRSVYHECWSKILECIEHMQPKIQLQALATAMKLLQQEGLHPLENHEEMPTYMPHPRLKSVLSKLLLKSQSATHLITKFQEFLSFDDVLFYTWKSLPSITARTNPSQAYIMNYLLVLEKLPVCCNAQPSLMCCQESFIYDEHITTKCLNKIWNCVMQWEHTEASHKQLLIVLLERVLPHLEKPLLMTDFLMDSLDVGGAISLLALQGIFTMIQVHNLDYPDIFVKLYSMFEPEIFHTKFKARLFYLADVFLSSTHLPEVMVAAFAKRLARLALVAPSQDVVVICFFIGNLILRHPALKCMINHSGDYSGEASCDPYIMEERDPVKSNGINSSLWEIRTLQNHSLPKVAVAARVISRPLPNVEWDITKYVDDTSDDAFDQEIKKKQRLIARAFDRPHGFTLNKRDVTSQYWNF